MHKVPYAKGPFGLEIGDVVVNAARDNALPGRQSEVQLAELSKVRQGPKLVGDEANE